MDNPTIRSILSQRILVLDGAMGTLIQERNLSAQDFGGETYEGCNEYLNLMRPSFQIRRISSCLS